MRKRLLVAAATAMIGLGASTVQAQVATNITVGQQRVYPNNGGGAWNVTSSVALGSANLTSFIAYCFDHERNLQTPNEYLALTFYQFINGVGAGPGGAPAYWNTVNVQDLNSMVEQVSNYWLDDATLPGQAHNSPIQQLVWDISNNTTAGTFGGDPDTYSNSWMVLVDKQEWEAGLLGQTQGGNRFYGGQSLLIEVPGGGLVTPEPSTYALMAAGLAGIAFAARRRRVS